MSSGKTDGFLVLVFARLFSFIQLFSAVEWVKKLGLFLLEKKKANCGPEDYRRAANLWIDLFVLAKWICVIVFTVFSSSGMFSLLLVSYLLFFNCFSYFIYHGWGSGHTVSNLTDEEQLRRDRRRLIGFLQAVFFSFLGFAYLYAFQISDRLEWPVHPNFLDGLYLSLSNSFTLTYSGFQPKDQLSRGVLLLQVVNMLFFITILVGNSVPSVGRSSR